MNPGRAAGIVIAGCVLAAVSWASLAPIEPPPQVAPDSIPQTASDSEVAPQEELFEIPRGTWERRMSGDKVSILPEQLRLTLGLRDVLLLRNLDDVPQIFGPTLLMPGQSFRLPFAVASSYQFDCTAHPSGQMTIVVDPFPDTPWARLLWRVREWSRASRPSSEKKSAAAGETATQ